MLLPAETEKAVGELGAGRDINRPAFGCVELEILIRSPNTTISRQLVAQMVKNLPAMRETRVRSLGQEDPLEKGMATHSSILAWRMP